MSFWHDIPKPIVGLAPMDGVTDASFRYITAAHGGPDVTITEFVNVESAFYAPQTLLKDFAYCELERPVVAQIYGHTPEMFYKVSQIACELGFDGIDINMGCPAKKIAAKGGGAALIRTPDLAQVIIRAVMQAIADWRAGQTLGDLKVDPQLIQEIKLANRARTGCETAVRRALPVSVKTRIGYDRIVIDEWIRTLLETSPAAITLHGRTLKQQYRGSADWAAIAQAAAAATGFATVILGNGDLRDMSDVCQRVRETRCDGVLVGRGAQGNPWFFHNKARLKQALRGGETQPLRDLPISLEQRFHVMLEHARHFAAHWGAQCFVGMRKHLAWYCHGMPNAAQLRAQLVRVSTVSDVLRCLDDYEDSVRTRGEHALPYCAASGFHIGCDESRPYGSPAIPTQGD